MNRYGNDINPYIIEMFKALQSGWTPSDKYSEEDYRLAKEVFSNKLKVCPTCKEQFGGGEDEKEIKDKIKQMIIEEINIAHKEGQPTSRLTSLYNKL